MGPGGRKWLMFVTWLYLFADPVNTGLPQAPEDLTLPVNVVTADNF